MCTMLAGRGIRRGRDKWERGVRPVVSDHPSSRDFSRSSGGTEKIPFFLCKVCIALHLLTHRNAHSRSGAASIHDTDFFFPCTSKP